MAIPHPPKDFQAPARKIWKEVLLEVSLDAHEMALLRCAARAVDRLEAIAVALQDAPLTVTNMKGDEVTHPLIVEERMTGQALARTIASLRLPQGVTDDGEMIRAQRRGGARQSYGLRSVSQ